MKRNTMATPEDILLASSTRTTAVPIYAVTGKTLGARLRKLGKACTTWAKQNGFKAKSGDHLVVPDAKGSQTAVLFGLPTDDANPFLAGKLARTLPKGVYTLEDGFNDPEAAALGFVLDSYKFVRYKEPATGNPQLICPGGVDRKSVLAKARAVFLTRDLINTPANDMGPHELEQAARALARRHNARIKVIKGAALERGFPLIHAVGKASPRAPRLVDLTWGPKDAPKVTIVGKGVVFDTGGLDIKPSSAMLLMKKDMGGAAHALGLASMVMDAKLPVRLRILLAVAENAVGGEAFRPGDIIRSRAGTTVEIGNTDAEGRLVMADALDLGADEKPDLLIDLATLTGAARVAMGPDLPPFFVDDDEIATQIALAGQKANDPVWRLPLWRPYEKMLDSKVADTNNVGSGFAGAITAALFLNRFAKGANHHIHFDVYGWAPTAKPGRPMGGEAQAIRALHEFLTQRYPLPKK